MCRILSRALLAAAFAACLACLGQEAKKPQAKRPAKPNPAFAPVEDVAGLPRVLLIGDSISIGYTLETRKLLDGKANIHRIPTNGGPTTNGVKSLAKWLGDGKWDVIHFNWGLHDIKGMEDRPNQVSPEDYEKNLRDLVAGLKATGATLIWASTTPVPEGDLKPPRKNEDVVKYNEIAARVMTENGVATNDLYAFVLPRMAELQLKANVHFSPQGSAELAKQVAAAIEKALPAK